MKSANEQLNSLRSRNKSLTTELNELVHMNKKLKALHKKNAVLLKKVELAKQYKALYLSAEQYTDLCLSNCPDFSAV
jgi:hypothetical protein